WTGLCQGRVLSVWPWLDAGGGTDHRPRRAPNEPIGSRFRLAWSDRSAGPGDAAARLRIANRGQGRPSATAGHKLGGSDAPPDAAGEGLVWWTSGGGEQRAVGTTPGELGRPALLAPSMPS